MAESTSPKATSGDFAQKLQRQLSRSKEKVLQRLGKRAETRDDQFDHRLLHFNDQQTDGNRIYKDLRNYANAVKDLGEASHRLSQSLFDVYENDWAGEEDLGGIVEAEELLWKDYEGKLLDRAVRTMESYVGQFPDVKDKVAKRGRKLVDYDSALHQLEALQGAKKRDDVKISKAEEEMSRAKSVYESINGELKDELPVLHDSRIGCYLAVFSAISSLREIFYKEMSTLNMNLQSVMKELQAQHPDRVFAVKDIQRYGSLKRRSLMSPKAWKASFSEFSRSSTPRGTPRSSLRSLGRSGHAPSPPSEASPRPSLRSSPDLEVGVSPSEAREEEEEAAAAAAGGGGKKPEEEVEGEAEGGASEGPAHSHQAPPSESSCELNRSSDSVSLELQLAAADNGPLHIEEEEDEEEEEAEVVEAPPSAAKVNGEACGRDPDDPAATAPHQEPPAENPNSKNTVV